MPKDNPNTQPIDKLRQLIDQEAEATQQYPILVEISNDIALDLSKMDAFDWHAASKGFSSLSECDLIVGTLFRDGVSAISGLSISKLGPILQLSTDLNAPPVKILDGKPYREK